MSNDPAHPAIYPTGIKPINLNSAELKVYDLIVKRFFATFGETAIFKKTKIDILVNDNFLFNKVNNKLSNGSKFIQLCCVIVEIYNIFVTTIFFETHCMCN